MSGGEIRFGKRSDWDKVSDRELVSQIEWNEPALRKAAQSEIAQFWRAWSQANAARGDRRRRKKRNESLATKWPWSESRAHPAAKIWSLIDKQDWLGLSRWATKQLGASEAWHDERTESELLVLADWLWNGPRVDVAIGFPIWRLVLTRALELSAYLAEPLTCDLTPDRRLMVTGELPWLLGQLFGEIDGVTEFRQLGQQSLRNELIELTDGDGTPSASLLPRLAHWLASLIRSVDVGAIVGEPLLEGESKFRFEDLVTKGRQTIRFVCCLLFVQCCISYTVIDIAMAALSFLLSVLHPQYPSHSHPTPPRPFFFLLLPLPAPFHLISPLGFPGCLRDLHIMVEAIWPKRSC